MTHSPLSETDDADMASPVNIRLVDDREANLLDLGVDLQALGQNLVKARSGEKALRLHKYLHKLIL